MGVKLAHAMGAHVVLFTTSPSKIEDAKRLGADVAETQEMLDFCGQHGITSDIEVIPMRKINEAHERILKSDVKYRFVVDMDSLRQ